jgi:hypothetical protein
LRLPVTAVAADPAGAFLGDEAGAHQDLDVARHRLQRNLERRRQLGDQQVFAIQSVEYCAANRVGKCAKHLVEGLVIGRDIGHDGISMDRRANNQLFC